MAGRRGRLLLFDVDGTLTKPMQCITEDFKRFLMDRVKPLAALGIVGGSDFNKIAKQMGGESFVNDFDHVFCENGLVQYKQGCLVDSQSMVQFIGEDLSQKFINFCLKYMSEIKLPVKRGNFVEFRTGMMNISPIGRSCTQAERDTFVLYDSENNIREKFVKAMENEFPDSGLQFSIGGQISIDVFPKGWDKRYCLQHLTEYDEIHFFGDKTTPGGNDYEIYEDSRTIGYHVASPDDTQSQIARLLNL